MKTIKDTAGQGSATAELEAISKRREEVIINVKQALATSLSEAAGHFKLLQQEGLNSILTDEQFKEACETLGITPPTEGNNGKSHTVRRTRVSNRKGVSFEDAIQRALSDGKARNVDDIYKRVQGLKGNDASRDTMLAVLSVVRKKGMIKNPARGQWQKA